MTNDFEFSVEENAIKKKWLLLLFILLLVEPAIEFGLNIFMLFKDGTRDTQSLFFQSLGSLLFCSLYLYIYYLCVYKYPGTRFLTINLVIGPILSAGGLMTTLKNNACPSIIFYHSIRISFYIWWYILSLKIRVFNKRVKENRKKGSANAQT